ncbi:MAG: CoA ester lyase [Alphaproteobacteria bacterium]|nr:CoA ester lyase [Alphaproteobacteria bacterium]
MPQLAVNYRSILFVPATRPERVPKAAATGADAVCVDLEDAVALSDKDSARSASWDQLGVLRSLGVQSILRINALTTRDGLHDMAALIDSPTAPDSLFVPKCDSAEEVHWIDSLLADRHQDMKILPIIETTIGLSNAAAIAGASPRVAGMGFGSADYSAEIGSDMGWDALAYGRGRIVAAAGQHGVAAIDGVWLDYRDDDGLRGEAERVETMGFSGKIAIHPQQVAVINQVFTPSDEAIASARRIVAAAEAAGGGVTTVDGQMIDYPVVQSARRVVAIAEHVAASSEK